MRALTLKCSKLPVLDALARARIVSYKVGVASPNSLVDI